MSFLFVSMIRDDEYWMNRCLILAKRGMGFVSPNPLVGAVIVKNGSKIGEGYHEQFGDPHAEINAIRDALQKKQDLFGATIYINLEPCFHYGKTPPCVDAIIRHGFSRVVVAMDDPNPLVAGKSIKKLKEHGIKVIDGILRKQANALNEKFIIHILRNKPFVALKAAQTSDGFIAQHNGKGKWITNLQSRKHVHQLRSEYDAILVGANTVIQDDPLLTVRGIKRPNPVRVIVDGHFSVPITSRIFNSEAKTILYTLKQSAVKDISKRKYLKRKGIEIISLKSHHGILNIADILQDLHKREIGSVFVEGGQRIFTQFMNARCVNKMYIFEAKKKYEDGVKTFGNISVSCKKKLILDKYFGTDRFREYTVEFP